MIIKSLKRPTESSGGDAESKTTAEQDLGIRQEPTADPVLQLQADLILAKGEADKWQDRLLRTAAEFDNYRKRAEREKQDAILLAKSTVFAELLPVIDSCERALRSFSGTDESNESLAKYREGFELVYRHLRDTLARLGVVEIKSEGERFDPNLHEALAREETLDHAENTVIQELRKGYLYRDRLLRAAQVRVAIRPSGIVEPSARPTGEKVK